LFNSKIKLDYYADSDYYYKKIDHNNNLITYQIENNKKQIVFYVECKVALGAINSMSFYLNAENGIKLFEVKLNLDKYIIIDKEDVVGRFEIAKKNIYFYCAEGQKRYSFILYEEEQNKGGIIIDILSSLIGDGYNSFNSVSSNSRIFDIYEEKNQKKIGRYFPKMNNLELTSARESEIDPRGALAAVIVLQFS